MPELNLYVVGQVVRVSVTLHTLPDNALADPSTLVLKILHPDGVTVDTYTYNTDPQPIRDSIGAYHADILVDQVGKWTYYFVSTGTAAGAALDSFNVNSSGIP